MNVKQPKYMPPNKNKAEKNAYYMQFHAHLPHSLIRFGR